jgi:hypothetical protein
LRQITSASQARPTAKPRLPKCKNRGSGFKSESNPYPAENDCKVIEKVRIKGLQQYRNASFFAEWFGKICEVGTNPVWAKNLVKNLASCNRATGTSASQEHLTPQQCGVAQIWGRQTFVCIAICD